MLKYTHMGSLEYSVVRSVCWAVINEPDLTWELLMNPSRGARSVANSRFSSTLRRRARWASTSAALELSCATAVS
jgi:hypothetical protein